MKAIILYITLTFLFCSCRNNNKPGFESKNKNNFTVDNLIHLIEERESGCFTPESKDSIELIITQLRKNKSSNIDLVNYYAFLYYGSQDMQYQRIEIAKEMLTTHPKDPNVMFSLAYAFNSLSEVDSSILYINKTKELIAILLQENSQNEDALFVDVELACLSNEPPDTIDNKIFNFCNIVDNKEVFLVHLRHLHGALADIKLDCIDASEIRLRSQNRN